ncbi:Bug family tripartite tricarboxylate transporter substrate binding protein [Pseudaquabacterium pictum]|uniref:MFS transporter n=1 Tax=Pseudaquabacterium pictum TaxID=2315236 RepID=A0A480AHW8_9BURK|nr:tripartite tricarboxylate transporter substrate binding protein [Rubrivivax pictus]GCL61234.1 MFS transporter [Rubrivivax pictus]
MRRSFLIAATASASLLALGTAAQAQAHATDWPTKTVRITTPFPAGAGPDAALRVLAEKLQKRWGKPVVVENKPGANGFIAIDGFKRATPDGHELIQLDNSHLVAYPHLFKKLPYDPVKDFEQVAPLFRTYFFVAVGAGSKYKTVGEIMADAKANPGKLNYGSWSVGNPVHLGSALLEAMTGTEMQHVIYKETSMLYTAVATGEMNWSLGSLATAGALQKGGKIKFIAVTAPKRHPAFPDVPTVAESGGPAGYEMTGWTTLATPPGLPKAVAEKIQKDVDAALAEPDMAQRFAAFGYEAFPVTREQFKAFIGAESVKYADVIKRAKASLD